MMNLVRDLFLLLLTLSLCSPFAPTNAFMKRGQNPDSGRVTIAGIGDDISINNKITGYRDSKRVSALLD